MNNSRALFQNPAFPFSQVSCFVLLSDDKENTFSLPCDSRTGEKINLTQRPCTSDRKCRPGIMVRLRMNVRVFVFDKLMSFWGYNPGMGWDGMGMRSQKPGWFHKDVSIQETQTAGFPKDI